MVTRKPLLFTRLETKRELTRRELPKKDVAPTWMVDHIICPFKRMLSITANIWLITETYKNLEWFRIFRICLEIMWNIIRWLWNQTINRIHRVSVTKTVHIFTYIFCREIRKNESVLVGLRFVCFFVMLNSGLDWLVSCKSRLTVSRNNSDLVWKWRRRLNNEQ